MMTGEKLEFNRQNSENEQIRQLQLELKRAQMDQHFIFNVLASIEYFLFKKDTQSAREYLKKFSPLIRQTLNNSRRTYITLQEDMCALKRYIELELFRLDIKHEVKIELDEKIDPTTICTQGLLIQPFVENAIKHGMSNAHKPCQLLVKITMLENELHCVVQDDGCGRDKKLIHLNSICSGITITQERLQYLHNHFRTRYVFRITDLVDSHGNAAGTNVQFTLPYEQMENMNMENNCI